MNNYYKKRDNKQDYHKLFNHINFSIIICKTKLKICILKTDIIPIDISDFYEILSVQAHRTTFINIVLNKLNKMENNKLYKNNQTQKVYNQYKQIDIIFDE